MYLQFFLKIINPIKQGYGFMVWAHGKAKELEYSTHITRISFK